MAAFAKYQSLIPTLKSSFELICGHFEIVFLSHSVFTQPYIHWFIVWQFWYYGRECHGVSSWLVFSDNKVIWIYDLFEMSFTRIIKNRLRMNCDEVCKVKYNSIHKFVNKTNFDAWVHWAVLANVKPNPAQSQ